MDALTGLVEGLNLKAKLTYWGGVCGDWLMDHNSDHEIWFHLLSKGDGWVHSPTWVPPLKLSEGDLVLFLPDAPRHVISYHPVHIPTDFSNVRVTTVNDGETGFVCGSFELGVPKAGWWKALPPEIVIRKADAGPVLSGLLRLISAEAADPRFGSHAVIERLCDAIFVLSVRHCMEFKLADRQIFLALQDPKLEPVLTAIHSDPCHPWTLGALCAQSSLSKTRLIHRFGELLGCSPMEYLAGWRIQLATGWLREPGLNLEEVAARCGYQSTSAFSKAFKRANGHSPGHYRRTKGCLRGAE